VVAPASVAGGATTTGTLTISGPAPAGGYVVNLSIALAPGQTGTTPATVPATFTVPAGATTGTFTITTSTVKLRTVVNVTTSVNGTSVTQSFAVVVP
jgi:hypothetical protein